MLAYISIRLVCFSTVLTLPKLSFFNSSQYGRCHLWTETNTNTTFFHLERGKKKHNNQINNVNSKQAATCNYVINNNMKSQCNCKYIIDKHKQWRYDDQNAFRKKLFPMVYYRQHTLLMGFNILLSKKKMWKK